MHSRGHQWKTRLGLEMGPHWGEQPDNNIFINIESLAIQSTDPPYSVGDKIKVVVKFYGIVTVTGSPQLTLKVGTEDKTANYTSGSGTESLVFEYTVASGDNDTDGISIEENKLLLNDGTIKDSDDNDATLTPTVLAAQPLAYSGYNETHHCHKRDFHYHQHWPL